MVDAMGEERSDHFQLLFRCRRVSHKSMADKPPPSQQSLPPATCSLSSTKARTTVTTTVSIAHFVKRLVVFIIVVSRGLDSTRGQGLRVEQRVE